MVTATATQADSRMVGLTQVTVGFSQGLQLQPSNVQVDLLRQLAATLDRCTDLDVCGLHFMVGSEGSGIDKLGNVWLDSTASPQLWLQ